MLKGRSIALPESWLASEQADYVRYIVLNSFYA